jgi:hypothetical protein
MRARQESAECSAGERYAEGVGGREVTCLRIEGGIAGEGIRGVPDGAGQGGLGQMLRYGTDHVLIRGRGGRIVQCFLGWGAVER